MSIIKNFYTNNKAGIIVTLVILLIGNIVYFGFGFSENNAKIDSKIFEGLKVKVAYTPEGSMKLFVNAKNNELSKIKSIEGQNLPESDSLVLGYDEAMMMKKEKLFTNMNDEIKGLFGIDTKIGGILKKTNSIIDDFHFLSEGAFDKIDGDENQVFVIAEEDGAATFYVFKNDEKEKLALLLDIENMLNEGSIDNYKTIKADSQVDSKTYYPLILGYKEAAMMRESKEFNKIGDKLTEEDKDFILIGILKQTNTSIDMMHVISLTKEELI